MKILVFNGSPKRDKSDTMHITRAFLDGMNESGEQDVHEIHIIDMHIEYCRGCFSCMHNGGSCIYDDDMKKILKEIPESDLLIFSFPLYAYGMPAPMKAMVDRLLPLTSMEMREVDGKLFPEDHTIITIPESPMFNASEAAPVTGPRLDLVMEAGKQYAEKFCISEEILEEIRTPMIPEEEYARIVNQC